MTPEEAFVQAITDSPDDETSRLVYADWLEERGDPRGEFLRLECRLRALPETCEEHLALLPRLAELGGGADVRWLAAVCRVHLETGPWHANPRRCPLNAPGPFYTCGRCLACEAPEHEAPDLLAELRQGNLTTYFVRQPRTAEEIERACRAALVCCVEDLRYGGTDPKVITRLGNDPAYCDYVLPAYRDYVLADSPRRVLVPAPRPRWEGP
jgi:uncharacterized protein (TIGR02996 family)